MTSWQILNQDLFDALPTLAADSIDACVTDPPYGIGFMGKKWDTFSPDKARASKAFAVGHGDKGRADAINPNLRGRRQSPAMSPSQIEYNRSLEGQRGFQEWTERWAREVLRLLKPGAHLLVCGAPRSFHRMASGLEDAGFEIRDCFSWLTGHGFPKSLNFPGGLGTALKPAWEPIIVARKPPIGSLTSNLAACGSGALNIDACRIKGEIESWPDQRSYSRFDPDSPIKSHTQTEPQNPKGRWPANVLLDEVAAALLDEQSGDLTSGFMAAGTERDGLGYHGGLGNTVSSNTHGDRGGASRFYYVAKPDRAERDQGCEGLRARSGGEATDRQDGSAGVNSRRVGAGRTGGSRNIHPTVKPVDLMRWLVRLVTPIDGTVLDPFTGSGTTGMAAMYEQRHFIGIEREAEYVEIARRRIDSCTPLLAREVSA